MLEPRLYEYPSGAKLFKVNNWGYLRFGPLCVYLSEIMADTYLKVRAGNEDTFRVCYRNLQIAEINAASGLLPNRTIKKL